MVKFSRWMDEDATWYGSIDLCADRIVLDGFPALRERGTALPLLGPCLLSPQSPISGTAELLFCNVMSLLPGVPSERLVVAFVGTLSEKHDACSCLHR